jgi:hypothetical protein
MVLFQTWASTRHAGWGFVEPSGLELLKQELCQLGITPWSWPTESTQFLGGPDVFVVLYSEAQIAARTKADYDRLWARLQPHVEEWHPNR